MRSLDNNQQAFLALVRAGLWETDVRLSQFIDIDYSRILTLAEEQSVVGLVTAGLEHVVETVVPKEVLLQFIGQTIQLEQCNKAMNSFIADMVERLRKKDIYTLLVKGQGVAQCYERPHWRSSGDVDFLLSNDNYVKAKDYLLPIACSSETESQYIKHLGMNIDSWSVELHGSLRCGLSHRMDEVIDEVQRDIFYGGNVRSWMNGKTTVFLPAPDNDLVFIFTHFLKHFYKGGLGVRQICDWCRLMWTYQKQINIGLLEKRIIKMGLLSEWKAFSSFAVNWLGMPSYAIPLYDKSYKWERKARLIASFVLESGNLGANRMLKEGASYSFIRRKFYSFSQRVKDSVNHTRIFPIDSLKFLISVVFHGISSALKGVG